jgi:putative hydroxymethylpyrimidine transport system substrate-binding protein
MKPLVCGAIVAMASTLALSSSALSADLTKFKYALISNPGIWDAAVINGIDRNFFADEGLEIELISPNSPADGLKLVASGGAELATAHSTDVITARSKDLPVVSIATNHQMGTTGVLVPVEAGVKQLKQLEGKNIGVTGIPFNKVMLEHSLKTAGADLSKVNIVTVGFTQMPLLLSKRIDALGDAISWDEPPIYNVQIEKPADDKSTYTYFTFTDYGVPRFYTFGLVGEEEAMKKNPDLYRAFLRAWRKGVEWMIANPAEAADGVIKHVSSISKAEAVVSLAEIARISVSAETQANGIGWQDAGVWEKQEKFMLENGLISTDIDVSKAVTNEYLTTP